MEQPIVNKTSPRRKFLQNFAAGATALGLAGALAPFKKLKAGTGTTLADSGPDEWFNKLKGKHRIVFDTTEPHEMFPFAWPKVFLLTNAATGTPEKDCNAVVILRHNAIPYALPDNLWAKYHFGEMFKVDDPKTKTASLRNAFWKPQPGDFTVPGIGPVPIGINELQDSGVMFCVCNMALTVYSAVIAEKTKQTKEDVYKELSSAVLPGIEIVPSGVWAVGRAQEHGCAYCFVR